MSTVPLPVPVLDEHVDFSVRVLRGPDGRVDVLVAGDVDELTQAEFAEALPDIWADPPSCVVVDLRRAAFFCISALNAIRAARWRAEENHVRLDVLTRPGMTRVLVEHLDRLG